jgi:hypothetical protein
MCSEMNMILANLPRIDEYQPVAPKLVQTLTRCTCLYISAEKNNGRKKSAFRKAG